jgi:hypothetical protein
VALERAIATWDARLNVSARAGETEVLSAAVDGRGDSVVVAATRTQERAFWITVRGTSTADGRPIPARATIAAATRLLVPAAPLAAALTIGGAATVEGGTVDGRDGDAGDCAGLVPAQVAGIIAPDSSRVCGSDCADGPPAGVTGEPPIAIAPRLTPDSAEAPGPWSALESRVTRVMAGGELSPRPVVVDGQCLYADALNWGDPAGGPCASHLPVIRITGAVLLAPGSVGQGVLLVDGSLEVAAGARFDGIVIVRNDVRVTGPGAELRGVVIALDVDGAEGSSVRDGGAVRFSGCAARRALLGAARLARTPERWWAELR